MLNYFLNILREANRLVWWPIIVGWSVLVLSFEFGFKLWFDWFVAYEKPVVIPDAAAAYDPTTSDQIPIGFVKSVAVFFVVMLYGVVRSRLYQPFSGNYRNWLIRSPWTADKPLPLGPLRIGWPDVVVVLLLAFPVCDQPIGLIGVLFAFLVAYIGGQLNVFYESNQMRLLWIGVAVCAISLLVPAPDRFWSIPLAILGFYGLLYYVQTKALQNLREIDCRKLDEVDLKPGNSSAPFGYAVGPNRKEKWQPDFAVKTFAVCFVWYLFCIGQFVGQHEDADNLLLLAVLVTAGFLTMLRLRVAFGHDCPFDRLASWRLIQREFDIVFLAPISFFIVAVFPLAAMAFGIPFAFSCPVAVAIIFLIFYWMPPYREAWTTTGNLRITRSPFAGANRKLTVKYPKRRF